MSIRLLIVESTEGSRFNRYVAVPDGMGMEQARVLADSVIEAVKRDEEDWQWDRGIEPALLAAGFLEVNGWSYCREEC